MHFTGPKKAAGIGYVHFKHFGGSTRSFPSSCFRRYAQLCPRVVIPAGMPVSSAMDGNFRISPVGLRYWVFPNSHIPVPGFWHPCQNDGISQTLVYKDESSCLGTSIRYPALLINNT